MIKLKNSLLFTKEFAVALHVLKQATYTTGKGLERAWRVIGAVDKAGMRVVNERAQILIDAALKGEDGLPLVENGEYQFESPEKKTETLAKVEAFFNEEQTLPQSPFSMSTIKSTELTVDMLDLLNPLILVDEEITSLPQANVPAPILLKKTAAKGKKK